MKKLQIKDDEKKRFNLNIPEDLFFQLEHIAKKNSVTTTELIRSFIKLGLIYCNVKDQNGKMFIEEASGDRRELIIFL